MKSSVLLALLLTSMLATAQSHSQLAAQAADAADTSSPGHLAPEAAVALADKKVPAVYPETARTSGIQGNVVLTVLISDTADVKEATVISGDPDLSQAAIEAIKQWKYKPYTVDGKPREFRTQVTFGFHVKTPPSLGIFKNGKYGNEFFGISYPLSTEWVREPLAEKQNVANASGQQSSSSVLLAALHVPKAHFPVVDSSLTLGVTPFPTGIGPGDGKDYLVLLAAGMASRKEAQREGDISRLEFGDLNFYRLNLRPSKGKDKYVAVLCTVVKGYALQWVFRAPSLQVLEEVVASLASLTKLEAMGRNPSPNQPSLPPPPPTSPARVAISTDALQALSLKTKVEPVYPEVARIARVQGTVVFHAVIDRDGNIIALEFLSGPGQLVAASIAAVKSSKYKPYLVQGQSVEVDTTIEVHFML